MKHIPGLALILTTFWLVNSGRFDTLLLSFGLLSVVLVMLITHRMSRIDGEYHAPVLLTPRLPFYLIWLIGEIIKSNMTVLRCIWQSEPEISPTIFTIRAGQQTDVCKVIYANSITMTPGTVTLEVNEDEFEVHALTRALAAELQSGEMDRQVRLLEN